VEQSSRRFNIIMAPTRSSWWRWPSPPRSRHLLAYTHFGPFRDVVDAVGRALGTAFHAVVDFAKEAISWISDHWPLLCDPDGTVRLVALFVVEHFGEIIDFIKSIPGKIMDGLAALPGLLVDIFNKGLDLVLNWLIAWPLLVVTTMISLGIQVITGIFNGLVAAVPIVSSSSSICPAGSSPRSATSRLAARQGQDGDGRHVERHRRRAQATWEFMAALPGRIVGFVAAAGSWLFNSGVSLLQGLANGAGAGAGAVWAFLSGYRAGWRVSPPTPAAGSSTPVAASSTACSPATERRRSDMGGVAEHRQFDLGSHQSG